MAEDGRSKEEKSSQPSSGITRRRFLAYLGIAAAGAVGSPLVPPLIERLGRLYQPTEEIIDSLEIIKSRDVPKYKEAYLPPDPENILPKDISEDIYNKLGLQERYSNTINKDAFHVIA